MFNAILSSGINTHICMVLSALFLLMLLGYDIFSVLLEYFQHCNITARDELNFFSSTFHLQDHYTDIFAVSVSSSLEPLAPKKAPTPSMIQSA